MCNRISAAHREAIKLYGEEIAHAMFIGDEWGRRYNIPPTGDAPVIADDAKGKRHFGLMQFGIRRAHPDVPLGLNAKSEHMLWRWKPYINNRCIIVCDGMFEWEPAGKLKLPWRFTVKDQDAFAIAGLWRPASETDAKQFVLVTTEANASFAKVHPPKRMPVVLDPEQAREWLDPAALDSSRVKKLCVPFPDARMEMHRVTTKMNSNNYEEPDAIVPLDAVAEPAKNVPKPEQTELF
ncbi:SOS response-associated peptidase [Oleiharenicola lentus]|uniref:SOS response-associated peptidase n=1 Tax=Oleiharenicola lentus TaxID=2508720 RepID=UPI003F67F4A2